MFYVYADMDTKLNRIFYYGSGDENRLKCFKRNKKHEIATIQAGENFKRIILFTSSCREECYNMERKFIERDYKKNYNCNSIIESRGYVPTKRAPSKQKRTKNAKAINGGIKCLAVSSFILTKKQKKIQKQTAKIIKNVELEKAQNIKSSTFGTIKIRRNGVIINE